MKLFSLAVYVDRDYYHTDYYSIVAKSREDAIKFLKQHRGSFKIRDCYSEPYTGEDKEGTIRCTNW